VSRPRSRPTRHGRESSVSSIDSSSTVAAAAAWSTQMFGQVVKPE